MMPKKLLLTGATGFLGWNICKAAGNDWQVIGIANNSIVEFPNLQLHHLDLIKSNLLKNFFAGQTPDAVIHTAAISDANYCQQHSEETKKINVTASVLLAELCAAKRIPFAFTSSDLVFDGKKGNYVETDSVNPVSKYGEQKAEAEMLIQKAYPDAAICRMPLMIGNGGPSERGYLNSFLLKAKRMQQLKLFIDEYRSPLGGKSAAKGLLFALKNFKGIYHLGGPEKLSRFELGEKIADAFKIPKELLIKSKQSEMPMSAPRPADVSLNSEKAYAAGFKPMRVEEELNLIRDSILWADGIS